MSRVRHLLLPLSACLSMGCEITGTEGFGADTRGVWDMTGRQAAPLRDLVGTFDITDQRGQTIGGVASWEELGGVGGIVIAGGPITGRAIGTADVDFDVTLPGGVRRFVARRIADTLDGTWVQASNATSGTFRAVRRP